MSTGRTGSMTVDEWARRHGFTRAFFYKLESAGKAPRSFKVGASRRISEQSDSEWVAAREAEEGPRPMDGDAIARLEAIAADLPETISMEDVKRHEWLRRLVIVADDLTNRIEYRALEWAKSQ